MSDYLPEKKLKLLYGDELIAKEKEIESKGFSNVCKNVLEKLMANDVASIHRCEVKFLLSKLKNNGS